LFESVVGKLFRDDDVSKLPNEGGENVLQQLRQACAKGEQVLQALWHKA